MWRMQYRGGESITQTEQEPILCVESEPVEKDIPHASPLSAHDQSFQQIVDSSTDAGSEYDNEDEPNSSPTILLKRKKIPVRRGNHSKDLVDPPHIRFFKKRVASLKQNLEDLENRVKTSSPRSGRACSSKTDSRCESSTPKDPYVIVKKEGIQNKQLQVFTPVKRNRKPRLVFTPE